MKTLLASLFLLPAFALAAMPDPGEVVFYMRYANECRSSFSEVYLSDRAEGDAILSALRDMELFAPFAQKARFAEQNGVIHSEARRELWIWTNGNSPKVRRLAFYRGTDLETDAPVWGVTLDSTNDCADASVRLVPPDAAAFLQDRFDAWDAADRPPFAAPGLDTADWQTLDFSGDSLDTASIAVPPPGGVLWLRHDFVMDSEPGKDGHEYDLTLPLFHGPFDVFLDGAFTVSGTGPIREWSLGIFNYCQPLHVGTNTLAVRLDFSPQGARLLPCAPSAFALRVIDFAVAVKDGSVDLLRTPRPPIPLDGTWHCLALPPDDSTPAP